MIGEQKGNLESKFMHHAYIFQHNDIQTNYSVKTKDSV